MTADALPSVLSPDGINPITQQPTTKPAVSPFLVDHLREKFPVYIPSATNPHDIAYSVNQQRGAQAVIEYLEALIKEKTDEFLDAEAQDQSARTGTRSPGPRGR